MEEVMWTKAAETDSLCDILLACGDEIAQTRIVNYLNTANFHNEPVTGIGAPRWYVDPDNNDRTTMYVMPIEFEHLIMMADVLDIKFVEGV